MKTLKAIDDLFKEMKMKEKNCEKPIDIYNHAGVLCKRLRYGYIYEDVGESTGQNREKSGDTKVK